MRPHAISKREEREWQRRRLKSQKAFREENRERRERASKVAGAVGKI